MFVHWNHMTGIFSAQRISNAERAPIWYPPYETSLSVAEIVSTLAARAHLYKTLKLMCPQMPYRSFHLWFLIHISKFSTNHTLSYPVLFLVIISLQNFAHVMCKILWWLLY